MDGFLEMTPINTTASKPGSGLGESPVTTPTSVEVKTAALGLIGGSTFRKVKWISPPAISSKPLFTLSINAFEFDSVTISDPKEVEIEMTSI